MSDRKFRFGVVAGQAESSAQWTELARRAENMGYATLLSPDTFNVLSPFASLAAAAAVTTELRLGTFVLATPLRTAGSIAWDTASLDRLSDGRFELGLGAGRPDAEEEARVLGLPFGSPGQRVDRLAETIPAVRSIFASATEAAERDPERTFTGQDYLRPVQQPQPPIMIAGSGRRLLGVAAREADIVGIGLGAASSERNLAEKVSLLRELAGDRFDELELSTNTFAVGESGVPEWMTRRFGIDPAQAADNQSIAILTGGPDTIADVLLRRRDEFGVSYVTVNMIAMEAFGPVIERLAGR